MHQNPKRCSLLKLQEQCRGDEYGFFVSAGKMRATRDDTGEVYFEEDIPMGNRCAVHILGAIALSDFAIDSAARKFDR